MNCLSVFYHSLGLALKGIIVRLVLPLKIIISGKINASAATARATHVAFYILRFDLLRTLYLVTLVISRIPYQKIQEFRPCYLLRETDTFPS